MVILALCNAPFEWLSHFVAALNMFEIVHCLLFSVLILRYLTFLDIHFVWISFVEFSLWIILVFWWLLNLMRYLLPFLFYLGYYWHIICNLSPIFWIKWTIHLMITNCLYDIRWRLLSVSCGMKKCQSECVCWKLKMTARLRRCLLNDGGFLDIFSSFFLSVSWIVCTYYVSWNR